MEYQIMEDYVIIGRFTEERHRDAAFERHCINHTKSYFKVDDPYKNVGSENVSE